MLIGHHHASAIDSNWSTWSKFQLFIPSIPSLIPTFHSIDSFINSNWSTWSGFLLCVRHQFQLFQLDNFNSWITLTSRSLQWFQFVCWQSSFEIPICQPEAISNFSFRHWFQCVNLRQFPTVHFKWFSSFGLLWILNHPLQVVSKLWFIIGVQAVPNFSFSHPMDQDRLAC